LIVIDQRTYRAQTKPTAQAKLRAKALRNEMTPPEKILWSVLRHNQVAGLPFRSQHAIGPYIADFYCRNARLVVEVDGSIHQGDQRTHDHKRDLWMQSRGIKVMRIQARSVFSELDVVLRTIQTIALRRVDELESDKE
jgi:very-short-patch-repair endonuclease